MAAENNETLDRARCACALEEHVNKKKIYTARRQDRKRAQTLGSGCFDVSHTSAGFEHKARSNGSSTGYEPRGARTEDSFDTYESKARYNVSPLKRDAKRFRGRYNKASHTTALLQFCSKSCSYSRPFGVCCAVSQLGLHTLLFLRSRPNAPLMRFD